MSSSLKIVTSESLIGPPYLDTMPFFEIIFDCEESKLSNNTRGFEK